jgi:hypothetical protein
MPTLCLMRKLHGVEGRLLIVEPGRIRVHQASRARPRLVRRRRSPAPGSGQQTVGVLV